MAVSIFSGSVVTWTDFGGGFQFAGGGTLENPALITTCLRAAGSGSHATLDWAVMRANGWNGGGSLLNFVSTGGPNTIWTDGTGDEMNCINTTAGAIGYADADRALGMAPLYNSSSPAFAIPHYTNTIPLQYNGQSPNRRNIRNGIYDNFYTLQWLYENTQNPDYTANPSNHPIAVALVNYASNASIISSTDRSDFWASLNEMAFMKDNDTTYPYYQGATTPVSP